MKYEMLEKRIEIVRKVVEEENNLSLEITDEELIKTTTQKVKRNEEIKRILGR